MKQRIGDCGGRAGRIPTDSARLLSLGLALVGLAALGAAPAEVEAAPGMTWWQAVVLGVVEGLTEYLPVSSTGHLLITQNLLGIGTESDEAAAAANAFAICIQGGAIIAVLGLYWSRVTQGLRGMAGWVGMRPGDAEGSRLSANLIVAFMPAAVIGLLLDDWIESKLFHPWPIVAALFVGGVAILAVSHWKKRTATTKDDVLAEGEAAPVVDTGKDLAALTWKLALAIGFIQCVAMWPGTSRSLVTIVGGVMVGLSLAAAVEFSFLLGVITLCAATVYKAKDAGPLMLDTYGWMPMLVGSFAAWLSAVIAVKWMVAYLKKHGLEVFGYYRIAIAALLAVLLLTGVMGDG